MLNAPFSTGVQLLLVAVAVHGGLVTAAALQAAAALPQGGWSSDRAEPLQWPAAAAAAAAAGPVLSDIKVTLIPTEDGSIDGEPAGTPPATSTSILDSISAAAHATQRQHQPQQAGADGGATIGSVRVSFSVQGISLRAFRETYRRPVIAAVARLSQTAAPDWVLIATPTKAEPAAAMGTEALAHPAAAAAGTDTEDYAGPATTAPAPAAAALTTAEAVAVAPPAGAALVPAAVAPGALTPAAEPAAAAATPGAARLAAPVDTGGRRLLQQGQDGKQEPEPELLLRQQQPSRRLQKKPPPVLQVVLSAVSRNPALVVFRLSRESHASRSAVSAAAAAVAGCRSDLCAMLAASGLPLVPGSVRVGTQLAVPADTRDGGSGAAAAAGATAQAPAAKLSSRQLGSLIGGVVAGVAGLLLLLLLARSAAVRAHLWDCCTAHKAAGTGSQLGCSSGHGSSSGGSSSSSSSGSSSGSSGLHLQGQLPSHKQRLLLAKPQPAAEMQSVPEAGVAEFGQQSLATPFKALVQQQRVLDFVCSSSLAPGACEVGSPAGQQAGGGSSSTPLRYSSMVATADSNTGSIGSPVAVATSSRCSSTGSSSSCAVSDIATKAASGSTSSTSSSTTWAISSIAAAAAAADIGIIGSPVLAASSSSSSQAGSSAGSCGEPWPSAPEKALLCAAEAAVGLLQQAAQAQQQLSNTLASAGSSSSSGGGGGNWVGRRVPGKRVSFLLPAGGADTGSEALVRLSEPQSPGQLQNRLVAVGWSQLQQAKTVAQIVQQIEERQQQQQRQQQVLLPAGRR